MTTVSLTQSRSTTKINRFTRILLGTFLSLLSMGMFLLAFPPFGVWPLVTVAFIPMLISQFRVMPPKWSSLASAITIGGWLGIFFRNIFSIGGEQIGLVWWMQGLPIIIGVITFVTDKSRRAFHEQTHYRWFVLEGALVWVGLEYIRVLIFGTWGFISHPLYNQAWLLQPVSIVGIFGSGLLIIAINYSLALTAIRWFDTRFCWDELPSIKGQMSRRWLTGTAVFTLIWVTVSLIQYAAIPDNPDTVRVAAAQPGTDIAKILGPDSTAAARQMEWDILFAQTRAAAADGAQLVVWPEGAYLGEPQVEQASSLQALTAETGVYLAFGYVVETPEGLRNESVLVTPQGEFLDVYGKAHPVFFAGETSVSHDTYPVHDTTLGKIGIPICYDLDFTDVSRVMAKQGAQILAAPSNDWSGIAIHHYTHTVFRAIENRTAIVKSERAYDSSVVDGYGRVLAHTATPAGSRDLLIADVALGSADSPYIFLGDWVGILSLIGFIFFMVYPEIVKRRQK
ncbi:MAG: apolipoprotein N-acyltransferase [Anaerolineales bacterium]|nr:apolipoprotein N-acyltransferase [Anaerolineales bacterium]